MHSAPLVGARSWRIWLFAGTGEGPALAQVLLQRGWRLRISVVSPPAARAYGTAAGQELRVGALAQGALAQELLEARRGGQGFAWVVDASHPFARRISASLATVCADLDQPLLRLQRPLLPLGRAEALGDLSDLGHHDLAGERLLLAIGARQLAAAVRLTPGAVHHGRILPLPLALQQATAAGLVPERIACLRPGGDGSIERALCRHWRLTCVLARRSGGKNEALWHATATDQGLRLLLLDRPPEPLGVRALTLEVLLEQLGWPGSNGP
jgi:precorrin-6A/cobalt-precorrin-6A reductase